MQNASRREASDLVNNYCCAVCWGHLIERINPEDPQMSLVGCAKGANCDGEGFVTKSWARQQIAESIANGWDARDNLSEYFPNPHKGRGADTLLKELGL